MQQPTVDDAADGRYASDEESAGELYSHAQTILESGPVGIALLHEDGCVAQINQTLAGWLGVRPGELMQSPLAIWLEGGRDGEALRGFLAALRRGEKGLNCQLNLLAPEGGQGVAVLVQGMALSSSQGVRYSLVLTDITPHRTTCQRLAEEVETYRNIADYTHDWESWFDPDGDVRWINPAVERLTGYGMEACMVMDDYPMPLFHMEDQHQLRALLKSGRDGIAAHDVSLRVKHRDTSLLWVSLSLQPMGQELGFRTSIRDISERRESERVLETAKRSAETASKAKSRFLSTMSHEIRSPMTAILGVSELMGATRLDRQQREYLGIMRRSGESLLELIDDILVISQSEAGLEGGRKEPFDLDQLLESVMDIMSYRASEKGVKLMAHMTGSLPRRVDGDGVRLRQILINLVGNAIKFTDQGEVVIHVLPGAAATAAGGETGYLFSVVDTGIGIPPGKREVIFDAFTQGDDSDTRRYGGTGLGLTICRRLVKLLGGQLILATSEIGVGSTFSFELSMAPASATLSEEMNDTESLALYGRRAVLLSPSLAMQGMMRELLESEGLAFTSVENHDELNSLLEPISISGMDGQSLCDFLLVDGVEPFPGMGVVDYVREIRQRPLFNHLRFVILGIDPDPKERHALCAADVGFVTAPLKRSAILQVMADVIASPGRQLDHACATLMRTAAHERVEEGQSSPVVRFLLAEDDQDSVFVIQEFLKSYPCHLDVVPDGEKALEQFKNGSADPMGTGLPYDLVIMDLQMPIMDGYTSVRQIRSWERTQRHSPVPVLAISAHNCDQGRQESLRNGCDGHVCKPLSRRELLKNIDFLIHRHRDNLFGSQS
uniref:histidine kinase n=1 Tax=Magnetococcus massalia (strain MO-1) TaxID=451514 RepID=A0A1S7LG94_MAGMO|nr:PAS/PAC sensor hybrid histidine kinase [Candidatus Magnetococcus massalia]